MDLRVAVFLAVVCATAALPKISPGKNANGGVDWAVLVAGSNSASTPVAFTLIGMENVYLGFPPHCHSPRMMAMVAELPIIYPSSVGQLPSSGGPLPRIPGSPQGRPSRLAVRSLRYNLTSWDHKDSHIIQRLVLEVNTLVRI